MVIHIRAKLLLNVCLRGHYVFPEHIHENYGALVFRKVLSLREDCSRCVMTHNIKLLGNVTVSIVQ